MKWILVANPQYPKRNIERVISLIPETEIKRIDFKEQIDENYKKHYVEINIITKDNKEYKKEIFPDRHGNYDEIEEFNNILFNIKSLMEFLNKKENEKMILGDIKEITKIYDSTMCAGGLSDEEGKPIVSMWY